VPTGTERSTSQQVKGTVLQDTEHSGRTAPAEQPGLTSNSLYRQNTSTCFFSLKSLSDLPSTSVLTMQILGHTEQREGRKGGLVAFSTCPGVSGNQTFDDYCKGIFKKPHSIQERKRKKKKRRKIKSPFPLSCSTRLQCTNITRKSKYQTEDEKLPDLDHI